MARYSAAYSGFIGRLAEVESLLDLARQISASPPLPATSAKINALCRSGVVLLSSHIEGYIEELAEIALERIARRRIQKSSLGPGFRYYFSRDLINGIKDNSDPSRIASKIDQLWRRDGHLWDSSPHFAGPLSADLFIVDFANPTHGKIKRFLNRFGYSTYDQDLARRLAADFPACTNMIDRYRAT